MIEINGFKWQIKRVESNHYMLMRNNGVFALGVTDRNTRTIYINNKLQGALLDKVVLHEITHAFVFSFGYDLSIAEEEFLCQFIALYGADIIKIGQTISLPQIIYKDYKTNY